ncbi:SDR family NAD(P)-dependent oxidoreductase [Psychrobacter sp. I-STPA10]|uniref:SDR family NAD(P)-dependent oxidoreductase n=1 Tax=Psychrobacter sp. I-STPA10 TaxID=2585769 RepID=UPI001E29AF50|nr:SDR family NAD(P)-dependent oxidoreductase [Psychrobacter sp. I-STPA10]
MVIYKRALVFGATSGIAQEIIKILITEGCSVYCVSRNINKHEALIKDLNVRKDISQNIGGEVIDLNRIEEHENIIYRALDFLGEIDVVFMAQGVLPEHDKVIKEPAYVIDCINTNATNVIHLITIVTNVLLEQERGSIVVLSSVAGDRGRQSNYVYGCSKGMLSIFLQGLRNRLVNQNIHVMTVKPGFVDTEMTKDIQNKGILWAQPDSVARSIIKALKKKKDIVYIPWFWQWIMLIIKVIPEKIFKRLSL